MILHFSADGSTFIDDDGVVVDLDKTYANVKRSQRRKDISNHVKRMLGLPVKNKKNENV